MPSRKAAPKPPTGTTFSRPDGLRGAGVVLPQCIALVQAGVDVLYAGNKPRPSLERDEV
jgi:hypothetical protein